MNLRSTKIGFLALQEGGDKEERVLTRPASPFDANLPFTVLPDFFVGALLFVECTGHGNNEAPSLQRLSFVGLRRPKRLFLRSEALRESLISLMQDQQSISQISFSNSCYNQRNRFHFGITPFGIRNYFPLPS